MTSASTSSGAPGSETGGPEVDWTAIERDPEYRRLSRLRQWYTIPVAVVCLGFYLFFLVLAVTSPHALGARLFGGFNLAYALMLTIFLLVWIAVFGYVFLANRKWDGQLGVVVERAAARHPDELALRDTPETGPTLPEDAREPQ